MSKLCTAPGCRNIVDDGSARCPDHTEAPSYTPKKRYQHHYHNGKRIYQSSRWRKLRDAHIAREPVCRHCLKYDIVTPAKVVDHIIEIEDGGEIWNPDNLQSLCHSCHNAKTAREAIKRHKNKGFKSLSDF